MLTCGIYFVILLVFVETNVNFQILFTWSLQVENVSAQLCLNLSRAKPSVKQDLSKLENVKVRHFKFDLQ